MDENPVVQAFKPFSEGTSVRDKEKRNVVTNCVCLRTNRPLTHQQKAGETCLLR